SSWSVKVQGFPEELPFLAQSEAYRSATEATVEQIVADTELVVHEGRIVIQDICCGQQELGSVQP
ncbi:MAG: hypothetical protein JWO52_399, partial [Gammaproteobacteria bacterium]|nr:hypothetical protein [Gammaproteobacteria bacterium]